jgi:hypothetical protein
MCGVFVESERAMIVERVKWQPWLISSRTSGLARSASFDDMLPNVRSGTAVRGIG